MNSLEKRSLYAFLSLYIISSTLFILLSAYWYYSAQKNALENSQYYKLEHISDTIAQKIIYAHMHDTVFKSASLPKDVHLGLIDTKNQLVQGILPKNFFPSSAEYIEYKKQNIIISNAAQEHLNIKYIVLYSEILYKQVESLKQNVLLIVFISITIMILLAYFFSHLFMKPLHRKIKQVEDFVHDTAHELNTPITALSMSVERALKKELYDEKILRNISISTKQLFDIYSALSYLSFDENEKDVSTLEVCKVLEKSVAYYKELANTKKIEIIFNCAPFEFRINENKLTMLFGNLINNAIKYSHPNSKITIEFKQGIFTIKDEGIGIETDKLSQIYERFERHTQYSGGFGIGLSIVKKICDEYGMKVDVISKIDEGSQFTLVFKP